MATIHSFEELECWKSARELRKAITMLVRAFPGYERYRLADQIIRSSRSVCANIAEGFGRYYLTENIHYCRQARGSLTETLEHLNCAFDEGFMTKDQFSTLEKAAREVWKLLNGYISYLDRSIKKDAFKNSRT